MEEKNGKNTFEYTYSAPTEAEKKQIESIRRQYAAQGKVESKIDRVRRLDSKVKNTATCVSLILGIAGCLTFGLGLTMILEWKVWLWGVVLMAIGCAPMVLSYPVYIWLFARGKKKYGDEILRLSEEILKK